MKNVLCMFGKHKPVKFSMRRIPCPARVIGFLDLNQNGVQCERCGLILWTEDDEE